MKLLQTPLKVPYFAPSTRKSLWRASYCRNTFYKLTKMVQKYHVIKLNRLGTKGSLGKIFFRFSKFQNILFFLRTLKELSVVEFLVWQYDVDTSVMGGNSTITFFLIFFRVFGVAISNHLYETVSDKVQQSSRPQVVQVVNVQNGQLQYSILQNKNFCGI